MSTTNFKSSGGFDANNQPIKNVADAVNQQDAINLQVLTAKNTVQPFNQTRTYPIDFIVEYNGQLWKCISPVTVTGGLFDKSKWEALAGQENWLRITASYTASAMDSLLVDTTSTAITITLPAVVASGDYVIIHDSGNASVNNITINRNGQTINGSAANLVIADPEVRLLLVYLNGTWVLNKILVPRVKIATSGLTALANQIYEFDITSSIIVTLPANPKTGDWVEIIDRIGGLGANSITITGNSKQIDGGSSISLTQKRGAWLIVYNGTSWVSYAKFGNSLQADKNLQEITNPADARTNLQLGSLAVMNTGTAAGEVRTNTQNDARFQQIDPTITALANIVTAADKLIYATGVDQFALADFPTQARLLLAATTQALQRNALGLGDSATKNVGLGSNDVLGVGGYGLGGTVIVSTNLDTIVKTGFYSSIAGITGHPSTGFRSTVIHTEFDASSPGAVQIAVSSNGDYYSRSRNSSNIWSTWVVLPKSTDLKSAAFRDVGVGVGNVLEVGALGIGATAAILTASTIESVQPSGFYRTLANTVGMPTTDACVLTVLSVGATNSKQIAYSVESPNKIWSRTYTTGSWSSWGVVHTDQTINGVLASYISGLVGVNGDPTKLIGVGGFGIGESNTTISSSAPGYISNLDDQTKPVGLYSMDASTTGTKPVSSSTGVTLTRGSVVITRFGSSTDTASGVSQMVFSGGGAFCWMRSWNVLTSAWTNWREFTTVEGLFPTWTTVTYANGWIDYDSTNYNGLQYRLEGKRVWLRGVVKNPSAVANTIATLPTGFRPIKSKILTTGQGLAATHNTVIVNSAGQITPTAYSTANNPITFDGLSFEID